MKGLEISERFFEEFGKPMLEREFCDLFERVSVGLAGEGSERFGFDDEVSKDHDFEAGFMIWLSKEDEEDFSFSLMRAYSRLPKTFMGLKRQTVYPAGDNRYGVFSVSDFFEKYLGKDFPRTREEKDNLKWLKLPSYALSTVTNGKVFHDGNKEFSALRENFLKGYPLDVKLKKLSANLAICSQSGQYNFSRSVKRQDFGSAGLCLYEFVTNALSIIYLLNDSYAPFYKWVFRGIDNLEILTDIKGDLLSLINKETTKNSCEEKAQIIDRISERIVLTLKKLNLTKSNESELVSHAVCVQNLIKDNLLRNLHLMDGV